MQKNMFSVMRQVCNMQAFLVLTCPPVVT